MSLVHLLKVCVKITPGLTGFTVGVLEASHSNCRWRCSCRLSVWKDRWDLDLVLENKEQIPNICEHPETFKS